MALPLNNLKGEWSFRYGATEFFSAYCRAVDRARDVLAGKATMPSNDDERWLLCSSGVYGMGTGLWTAAYADDLVDEVRAHRATEGRQ